MNDRGVPRHDGFSGYGFSNSGVTVISRPVELNVSRRGSMRIDGELVQRRLAVGPGLRRETINDERGGSILFSRCFSRSAIAFSLSAVFALCSRHLHETYE